MEDFLIEIGNGNPSQVMISALYRTHPQATDYWDGNWISCKIIISAGAFSAKYKADLRGDEINRFLSSLQNAQKDLREVIEFSSMELWLKFKILGDGLGHFSGECVATDTDGFEQPELSFSIQIDQTDLPKIINQTKSLLKEFPIVGSVDA